MDNLAWHKVTGVRQAIEAAGGAQVRYLLPYNPDMNPIDQVLVDRFFGKAAL